MSLTGIILAGGASRRMGSPKALLELDGETFLDRLTAALGAACDPVIVVLGHQAERVRQGSRRCYAAVFVTNAEPERGQLSSLQTGLRAAPAGAAGFVFTPVDYPAVRPATVRAVADEFTRRPAPVVAPVFRGRRGHPVCVSAEVAAELLALPEGAQARDVIRRYPCLAVEVDDPGILEDVDEPADYARLLGRNP